MITKIIAVQPPPPTPKPNPWPRIYSSARCNRPTFELVFLAFEPDEMGLSRYITLSAPTPGIPKDAYPFQNSAVHVQIETPVQVTFNP